MKHFTLLKTTLLAVILVAGSVNVWGQYAGTGTFTKLTSVDDLTDGYYTILNETDAFIMTSERSGSASTGYFVSATITVSNGDIIDPPQSNVWKIQTDGDGKTIYNEGIGKYAGWSSGNSASIEDTPANTNRWTFTYADSKFTVKNVATPARQLSYNNLSPRFAAYGNNGQQELQLYKLNTSTPACTSSNLVFAAGTINKGITEPSFIITATSLNETTPIAYTSSDKTVATVDETTGEVTLVSSGTSTITASQIAGTHVDVEYCAGSASYILTVEPIDTPVATDATGIKSNGFTANWNAVNGADSYELNVYSGKVLFDENFDAIDGTGGNDDRWSGTVASSSLSDFGNWTLTSVYKGNNCLKLGTGSKQGAATTPALGLNGNATLTFRAGAWAGDSEELTLDITGGGTLSEASVIMIKEAFTEFSVNIIGGTADTKISFKGMKASDSRFFLDDVRVDNLVAIPSSPFTTTATSYEVTNLTPETEYFYTVVAKAGEFSSAPSNEISVTTLKDTGTGLDNTSIDTPIWTAQGKVMVYATSGDLVEVYNVAGQKLVSRLAIDDLNSIDVAAKGVLVVKVGNRTAKVIL